MNSITHIVIATEMERVGSSDDILYSNTYYFLELKTSSILKRRWY